VPETHRVAGVALELKVVGPEPGDIAPSASPELPLDRGMTCPSPNEVRCPLADAFRKFIGGSEKTRAVMASAGWR
jgi:hypothetical protein